MAFAWFVVRLLIVTVGFAALHGYVWWRLFRDTTKPGSAWRPIGALLLGVLAAFGLLARFFAPSEASLGFQAFVGWPGWIWFGVFMYLFGLLVVTEPVRWYLLRRKRKSANAADGDESRGLPSPTTENDSDRDPPAGNLAVSDPDPPGEIEASSTSHVTGHTRRLVVSRAIGLGASAVALATVGHGLYEGYRTPPLKSVIVPLARLDRRYDGYRIAVVGDTHFSAIRGRGYCERVVEQINSAQADLIAFVGDLASNEADQIREATDPLAGLG
ncbi:MAG TPA: hypothetical protein VHG10_11945, partial [Glycomyces sp.]|nr:hypothetical protein [Glycomyces sp.]